ncbi:hypothetical protein H8D29_05720 [PVC group bacterium]|nr:hypothetical protein [PVC group bacterium]
MTRDTVPLLVAVTASMSIHLAIVPLFVKQGFATPLAPPPNASHLETPPLEQPEIVLGIESSQASTLTWIGYDQYCKHLARLAEVEQAAMRIEKVSPQTPQKEATQKSKEQVLQTIFDDLSITTAPITIVGEKLLEALRNLRISIASPTLPSAVKPTHAPQKVVKKKPLRDAESSDLEADATSILEVPRDNWKTGRPLAAEGIILRPRRPSFTAHQIVSNAPSGLKAVLVIDNRGRPIAVEVVSGTGSSSIDRSLIASLYRWRAAGEKIDALATGDTLRITIHLSFAR